MLTIRNLMAIRLRQPVQPYVGNARSEARVRSFVVVVMPPLVQDAPKVLLIEHDGRRRPLWGTGSLTSTTALRRRFELGGL